MKKTLNKDVREAIYDRLKNADTIIQSVMPLIKDDLIGSDDQGMGVIRLIFSKALSELDEAKRIMETI